MKSLTAMSTQLTKDLRDLNQEVRRKLSFMPSYTEQEMKNLEQWLEEVETLARDLENHFLIISQHSNILKIKLQEQQKKAT